MRATLRWICAGTLTLGAVAMIGCEKKSETTNTSGSSGTPTTMESAKQSVENAANKATDKAKEMGTEMKQAASQAAEKTKDAAKSAEDKATQAVDSLKK
jgi:hypothetical protein